jgi:hypothetical protein
LVPADLDRLVAIPGGGVRSLRAHGLGMAGVG